MSLHHEPAPVVLFVRNRPRHTWRTLEALAANTMASGTPLFIVSEPARVRRERYAVERVRELARTEVSAQRFAAVTLIESSADRGLAEAVVEGVNWLTGEYGKAIVLEGDHLAAPDFLYFMNACLRHYELDATIGSVCGYSPLRALPPGVAGDVYALPRTGTLGWATWDDRWREVDWNLAAYDTFRQDEEARTRFDRAGADNSRRLDREMSGRSVSWSTRFGFWQFLTGRMTIHPRDNRIISIGGRGRWGEGHGFPANTALADRARPFKLHPVREDPRVTGAVKRLYTACPARRFARQVSAALQWAAPPLRLSRVRSIAEP